MRIGTDLGLCEPTRWHRVTNRPGTANMITWYAELIATRTGAAFRPPQSSEGRP